MNLSPIQGDYVIPKGFLHARFEGNDYFEELGDVDDLTITVETERDERKDNRFGRARTSDEQITEISVNVSMTLMQHTPRNRALANMGSLNKANQTAQTGIVKVFENAVALQAYDLGKLDVSNVVVSSDEDGTTVIPSTEYYFDGPSGLFQPKTVGTYYVKHDCAAILPVANRLKTGIGGNANQLAELIYTSTNTFGPKSRIRLWKVRLTPSGGRGLIGTERAGLELEGKALADAIRALEEGNAEEYAFGYETTLAA